MFAARRLKQPQCELKIVSKQQGILASLDKIKPFPKRKQLKTIYVKVMNVNVTKWLLSLKNLYILTKMNLSILYHICIFLSSFLKIVSKTVDFITIKKKKCFLKHLFAFNGCETEYLSVNLFLKSSSILHRMRDSTVVQRHRSHVQSPYWANTEQSESGNNSLLFYPHQTAGCNKDYGTEDILVLLSRLSYFGGWVFVCSVVRST